MSWLGLLLVGVALTDLTHSIRPHSIRTHSIRTHSIGPVRWLPEAVGAVAVLVLGPLAGLVSVPDLVATALVAATVVLWGRAVTWGFGRRRAWLPLLVLSAAVALALLLSPMAGSVDGLLGRWLAAGPHALGVVADGDRFLLLLGVVLAQMSTGNVVVRLVLEATGTVNPDRHGLPSDPETRLKGGRLLGPMERLFILGLGVAGQLTAAAIVIAAKGLLRWPELSSKAEAHRVHQLTEYFLVGSFVSWLFALGSLLLVVA